MQLASHNPCHAGSVEPRAAWDRLTPPCPLCAVLHHGANRHRIHTIFGHRCSPHAFLCSSNTNTCRNETRQNLNHINAAVTLPSVPSEPECPSPSSSLAQKLLRCVVHRIRIRIRIRTHTCTRSHGTPTTTTRDSCRRPLHLRRTRPRSTYCGRHTTPHHLLVRINPDARLSRVLQQHLHHAQLAAQEPRSHGRLPPESNAHSRSATRLSRQCFGDILREQPNLRLWRLRPVHRRGLQPCAALGSCQPPMDPR